ncbi:MAG: WbqC family protein [Flavobacteriales bacterium]|nr:WbqC family protein [Flavobacteriales bacterium]
MNSAKEVISPLSLVPPIGLFMAMARGYCVTFDAGENYVKQTIRNRYHILAANGVQALTINVVGQKGTKIQTAEVLIDYEKDWVRIHKRAIESAYRSSPFFDHYYPKITSLLNAKHKTLKSFFDESIITWCSLLRMEGKFTISQEYVEKDVAYDLRLPIKSPDQFPRGFDCRGYLQVFSDRFDFVQNLSVIDLLFNEGPAALTILKG